MAQTTNGVAVSMATEARVSLFMSPPAAAAGAGRVSAVRTNAIMSARALPSQEYASSTLGFACIMLIMCSMPDEALRIRPLSGLLTRGQPGSHGGAAARAQLRPRGYR